MNPEEAIKDIKSFCSILFKNDNGKQLQLTSYQVEIIDTILFRKSLKTICRATTRAGKSLAVALAIILLAIFSEGEKIRIVAPTGEHTKIIMNYVIQHILDHEMITSQLEIETKGIGAERLKRELSKSRITFRNNSEIQIISANITGTGRSLVGFGGTAVFVDEAEIIPVEIIKTKVMRMLGDSPNSLIFMIGNPLKRGYMYEKRKDPAWKSIRVDWKQAVKEGRLTKEFVEERKADLTPLEFRVWYDAEFPEDTEDTLIKWAWIQKAVKSKGKYEVEEKIIGCDIAAGGIDYTIIASVEKTKEGNYILDNIIKKHEADTMATTGYILQEAKRFGPDKIVVDAIGVGKGVVDRLAEQKAASQVIAFKSGRVPTAEKDRFTNQKAQQYWRLRNLFEEGRIIIPDNSILKNELNNMRCEIKSSGKIQIIDPSKSPDYADSLMLACSITSTETFFIPAKGLPMG